MTIPPPLCWPEHFPPKRGLKKFFLGVRWLGPDLSFFGDLRSQQASRTPDQMAVWGGGVRQEIAERIAANLQKGLRWPTAVFFPGDSWSVMCNGPTFGLIDDFIAVEAIDDFEDFYGAKVPREFWESRQEPTFGEIVDGLALLSRR